MNTIDLGLIDYGAAYEKQKEIHSRVLSGELPQTLIVCAHNPVITIGRSAKNNGLKLPRGEYISRGISVVDADRGGDVTYHGPGQVIVYPIYKMASFGNDLHAYIRFMENAVIYTLNEFGIRGRRLTGKTGVWVEGRKICSIGIAVKHWVSYHGLALYASGDDLANFNLINPCGMDIAVTSVEKEMGRTVSSNDITAPLTRSLSL